LYFAGEADPSRLYGSVRSLPMRLLVAGEVLRVDRVHDAQVVELLAVRRQLVGVRGAHRVREERAELAEVVREALDVRGQLLERRRELGERRPQVVHQDAVERRQAADRGADRRVEEHEEVAQVGRQAVECAQRGRELARPRA
jgi:hypothetical protein